MINAALIFFGRGENVSANDRKSWGLGLFALGLNPVLEGFYRGLTMFMVYKQ